MMKAHNLFPVLVLLVSGTLFRLKNIDANAVNPEGGGKENTSTSNCDDVVVKRYENITKSSEDKREYRYLILNNDCHILLVSDSATDTSGVSLTVNTGWIDTLPDLQGSPHFLEHMLFMGSGKFPKENDFMKFINEHAGFDNGNTIQDMTSFYFELSPNSLAEAIDRLAQFFIDPLMLESSIEKEVKIVDGEYQIRASGDGFRLLQLMQHLSKPDHPNNVFACGNLTSLYTEPKAKGIKIRDRLFELYNTRYSSNVMYLGVYGKEPPDALEKMVVPLFKEVKNKKIKPTMFEFPDNHPWGPEQLKKQVSVLPVEDMRMVQLVFATPDVISQYSTSPDDYVSYVLGYGGPGSLLSLFKSKDLCDVGGDYYSTIEYERFAGCGFFNIRFSLTEAAIKLTTETVNYIVETVFQYIQLVKTDGVQKWIFDENLKKNQLFFKFQDQSDPSSYLGDITPIMKYARPEDVLSISYLHEKWEPKIIEDFLTYLRPDNMNIFILSQSFKDIVDQTEPYMGAQYKIEPIADDLIQKWSKVGLNPDLQLPKRNELIAENFDLYPIENKEQKFPTVLQESKLSRFWFLQDTVYKLPKLFVKFEILCPTASSATSPENSVLSDLFASIFIDSMEEYTYLANQAGLSWAIYSTDYGFEIEASGFNDKLLILLEKIMSEIFTFKLNEKRFANLKEAFVSGWKNFDNTELRQMSRTILENLIGEKSWTIEELLKASEILQPAKMEQFRKDTFTSIYIQGLIYGNANKQVALDIVNAVEKPFLSAKFASPEQIPMLRRVKLNDGSNFVYEKLNSVRPTSYYNAYFQIGPGTLRKATILKLLTQIVREPMFNTLRTEEQLCYYTSCRIANDGGILGYTTEMESDKHPVYQSYRISEFLGSMKKTIEDMTDEEYETQKTSVREINLMKPKDYYEMSCQFWDEITNRFYLFDRLEKEVQELETITKAELLAFYEMTMSKTCQSRKIAVYITSQITKPEVPKETPPDKSTKIPDIVAFREAASYHSYPPPSIEISPLGSKNEACPPAEVEAEKPSLTEKHR